MRLCWIIKQWNHIVIIFLSLLLNKNVVWLRMIALSTSSLTLISTPRKPQQQQQHKYSKPKLVLEDDSGGVRQFWICVRWGVHVQCWRMSFPKIFHRLLTSFPACSKWSYQCPFEACQSSSQKSTCEGRSWSIEPNWWFYYLEVLLATPKASWLEWRKIQPILCIRY